MTDKPRKPAQAAEDLGLDAFSRPQSDAGLSLEQLTAAFAEMLEPGDRAAQAAGSPMQPAAALGEQFLPAQAADPYLEPSRAGGPVGTTEVACETSPRSILEAMLFVGQPDMAPLTSRQVASLMRGVRPEEIDELVTELNAQYDANECPYRIKSEGPGYRLLLRDEHNVVRDAFYGRQRMARLSPAAVEILSLVAYNGSLTGSEINRLRGRTTAALLRQLVRRQLLRVERSEDDPRERRYFTTRRFLRLFGLESLDDLPRGERDVAAP